MPREEGLVHSTRESVYSLAREQHADDLELPMYSIVDWRCGGDEAGDGDELKGIANPLRYVHNVSLVHLTFALKPLLLIGVFSRLQR